MKNHLALLAVLKTTKQYREACAGVASGRGLPIDHLVGPGDDELDLPELLEHAASLGAMEALTVPDAWQAKWGKGAIIEADRRGFTYQANWLRTQLELHVQWIAKADAAKSKTQPGTQI